MKARYTNFCVAALLHSVRFFTKSAPCEQDNAGVNNMTLSGKRLFKIWVCQPLRSPKAINDRLDAVEEIMHSEPFQDTFDSLTKTMPDVERLLSRIHAKNVRVKDL